MDADSLEPLDDERCSRFEAKSVGAGLAVSGQVGGDDLAHGTERESEPAPRLAAAREAVQADQGLGAARSEAAQGDAAARSVDPFDHAGACADRSEASPAATSAA